MISILLSSRSWGRSESRTSVRAELLHSSRIGAKRRRPLLFFRSARQTAACWRWSREDIDSSDTTSAVEAPIGSRRSGPLGSHFDHRS